MTTTTCHSTFSYGTGLEASGREWEQVRLSSGGAATPWGCLEAARSSLRGGNYGRYRRAGEAPPFFAQLFPSPRGAFIRHWDISFQECLKWFTNNELVAKKPGLTRLQGQEQAKSLPKISRKKWKRLIGELCARGST
jgi:hypothetical protein